jgi:glycosyltransferase involved in cell wall biosynthesis
MNNFKHKFKKIISNAEMNDDDDIVKTRLYSVIPKYWQTKLGIAEKVGSDALDLVWVEPRIPIIPKNPPHIYNIFGKGDWCDKFIKHYYEILRASDVVIFAPWIKTGGADKVLKIQIDALKTKYRTITLVLSDGEADNDAVMEDVKIIKYYEDSKSIPEDAALMAFAQALLTGPNKYIHVANSALGYKLIERYHKRLRDNCRLGANIFCNDRDKFGLPVGYLNRYKLIGELLDVIYTDNEHTKKLLIEEMGVDDKKIKPLRIPVSMFSIVPYYLKYKLDKIETLIWASRLDRQKAPNDLMEIAQKFAEINFRVYGDFILSDEAFVSDVTNKMSLLPNVKYMGPFANIADINFNEAIFLYTSHWDGLPNIVLEVGALGVPIISYPLPGIRSNFSAEEITFCNAFGVAEMCKTIKTWIDRPSLLLERAKKCRDGIIKNHVMSKFISEFVEQ